MHDLKPDDTLSRFLFRRHYINFDQQVVKTSVFTEKHPDGFSVFHTTALSDSDIWQIAYTHVALDPNKPLLGRCDLEVTYYEQANLRIEKDEPPPRHHNIFGMPVGSDMEEARKLSLRQTMVATSRFKSHS
jgi:hypothetical protein